jgi:hypothetical protein
MSQQLTMVVWLEGALEAVDSLTGIGSRAAYQAKARMLVQPLREVPVMMTEIASRRSMLRKVCSQNDHGT